MRVLGIVGVLLVTAALRAQSPSVEDLFASDWKERNRAAAALVQAATVDEVALVAAMKERSTPALNTSGKTVGIGDVSSSKDSVRDIWLRFCHGLLPHLGPESVRTPLAEGDLVVPFSPRILATFVLQQRGVRTTEFTAALLSAAAEDPDEEFGVVAASYLWRLEGEAAATRNTAFGQPQALERLVQCVAVGGDHAEAELLTVLRTADPTTVARVIRRFDAAWVAARPALVQQVIEWMRDSDGAVGKSAAGIAQAAALYEREEFAAVLLDPVSCTSATRVLFELPKVPKHLAPALAGIVRDESADYGARLRAAFALHELGPSLDSESPELARTVCDALESARKGPGFSRQLEFASTAALGRYAQSMSSECEKALVRDASNWYATIHLFRSSKNAALSALLDSRRADALSLDDMKQNLQVHVADRFADRLVAAIVRRGPAAGAVLRAVPEVQNFGPLPRSDLVAFAPTLRQWLDDEDPAWRRFAVRQLAHLGAEAGVDVASVRELVVEFGGLLADEGLKHATQNWFAEVAQSEAEFDWLAERWRGGAPTSRAIQAVAEAPFPFARRQKWLVAMLEFARADSWPVASLTPDELRSIARELAASRRGGAAPFEVLCRFGPLQPEDEALFVAALDGRDAPLVLEALSSVERLTSRVREAVERLCQNTISTDVGVAVDVLWRTRAR